MYNISTEYIYSIIVCIFIIYFIFHRLRPYDNDWTPPPSPNGIMATIHPWLPVWPTYNDTLTRPGPRTSSQYKIKVGIWTIYCRLPSCRPYFCQSLRYGIGNSSWPYTLLKWYISHRVTWLLSCVTNLMSVNCYCHIRLDYRENVKS